MPFDPNKSFEKVGEEPTSEFDPSQDFDVVQEEAEAGFFEENGEWEAGVVGVAQGLTFGYSDEIIAGMRSAFSDQSYDDALIEERAKLDRVREAQPVISTTADIAASALLPIPGSRLRAASVAGKAGLAAAKGAGIGALEASGRTEEDLLSVAGAKDVLAGAAIGGVAGPLLEGAGTLIGSGAKKISTKIKEATPTQIREGAMHKTPTQRSKEVLFPQEAAKNTAAVKAGEKFGVFKGSLEDTLTNTTASLKQVGQELGASAIESSAVLGNVSKLTKGPLILKSRTSLDDLVKATTEGVKKGRLDTSSGKKMTKVYREEFGRLKTMIEESDNSLSAIRELKSNIYNRLDSSDFQFGGPKAGTPKDALKNVIKELRSLEKASVRVNEKLIKQVNPQAKVLETLKKHASNLDDYKDLKKLQEQLASTATKQVGRAGLKEITAGAVGATINPLVGAAAGIGQFAKKTLETPKGRFWVAKAVEYMQEGKTGLYIDKIAEKLDMTGDQLRKHIGTEGAIAAGAAGADGA